MKSATLELASQQMEKEETKRLAQELSGALQALQQQLQAQQAEQLAQKAKITALQQRIITAPDTKAVNHLKVELTELKIRPAWGEDAKHVPPSIPGALKKLADELQRQRGILEKASVNLNLRNKLQPKIQQLTVQQQQYLNLQESFSEQWAQHCSAQEAAMENLQEIISQAYFACDERLKQLETDVAELKHWAGETQVRLQSLESEESQVQLQLMTLQSQLAHWITQQEGYQIQLTSLQQALQQPDEKQAVQLQLSLKMLRENLHTSEQPEVSAGFKLAKQLYKTQQEDVSVALKEEVDEELHSSLAETVSDLNGKIKILDEVEARFTELQKGALTNFQMKMQILQQDLEELTQRVFEVEKKTDFAHDRIDWTQQQIDKSDPRYTLAVRLKKLREKILADDFIQEELSYYIAPNGQRFPSTETSTPLQPWVEENFLNHSTRVLLLQGPGGSGKSTFNRHLLCELWKNPAWDEFKPGSPAPNAFIPLFVPLGSSKVDPRRLFEYLRDFPELVEGFTDAEINILKSDYQLLWIADGYDEMPGNPKINLYDANGFDQYKGRVKLLISRRSDPLSVLEERTYLMPSSGDGGLTTFYQNYYVAPFTDGQVSDYITQYLVKKRMLQDEGLLLWEDVATYQKYFAQISGIKQLISVPFLLMIAVETLPTIVKEVEREQASRPSQSGYNKIELTRKKLLGGFVNSWFNRQAIQKALPARDFLQEPRDLLGDDIVEEVERSIHATLDMQVCLLKAGYLLFCQEFAKNLQREHLVSIIYPPLEEKRAARLGGDEVKSSTTSSSSTKWIKSLFDPTDKDMACCRRGSPLRKTALGQGRMEYGFMHGLLVDYFVSSVLEKNAEEKARQTTNLISQSSSSEPGSTLMTTSSPALQPTLTSKKSLPLTSSLTPLSPLPNPVSPAGSKPPPTLLTGLQQMILGKTPAPSRPPTAPTRGQAPASGRGAPAPGKPLGLG
jgi:hypothetical protein